MVPRAITVTSLIFLGLCGSVLAGLDLSPRLESYELDGVKMSQLTFGTGTQSKASYQPPADWKYSGGKDHLDLQPPALAQAKAKISQLSIGTVLSFDGTGRQRLREEAILSLPRGSQEVEVTSEELNPLQIDGKQTYLVELTYTFFGEKFACYSLFLNRQPEALSFRLSCRAKEYPELRQAFHKSLYTWQNL